ncbi:Fc.00g054370.m01.CDS01 [Cosmosporella sp. VM-42]
MDMSMGNIDALAAPIVGEGAPKYMSDETAAARINPAIRPDEDDWKSMNKEFRELLATDKTIQQILSMYFTQHEAKMFVPEDRHDIKALQQRNTDRYYALLNGRFKDVPRNLATKFTMMYFGLPVEPMISPFDELLAKIETREPEAQRYRVDPPLHYLTAHNRRNWGEDSMKGDEALNYPMPIQLRQEQEVGLRGGAASDDGEEYDVDYFNGPKGDMMSDDQCIPLFGFQGCIPIVPEKWKTYANAVRQLLSLYLTDDTLHSYSLIHFDRKTQKQLLTTQDTLPLNTGSPSLHYLQNHFKGSDVSKHYDCCAFFVQLRGETSPHYWEPHSEQFKTDLGRIAWSPFGHDTITTGHPPTMGNRIVNPPHSYAYLPFPKIKEDEFDIYDHAVNQYSEHLRAAIEVLVGMPDDSCHRSTFRLWDTSTKSDSMDKAISVYGALSVREKTWNCLHPLNNPDGCWFVDHTPLDNDELAFVLPHYFPKPKVVGTVFKSRVGKGGFPKADAFPYAEENIRTLVYRALGDEIDKMKSVLVLPGPAALGPNPTPKTMGYLVPIKAIDPNPHQESLSELLQRFIDEEQEPYVLLHPVWKPEESLLWGGWEDGVPFASHTPMPPLRSSLKDLRDAVNKLASTTWGTIKYRPDEDYIYLYPYGEFKTKWTDFPSFVIAPDTTELEWYRIRAGIPFRQLGVHVLEKKEIDWQSQIPKSNAWGPRYRVGRPGPPAKTVTFDDVTITGTTENQKPPLPKTPVVTVFNESRNARSNPFVPDNEREVADTPMNGDEAQQERGPGGLPREPNDRERTWATQPSLFDGFNPKTWPACEGPKIPINAPPAEHILRTSSNVPMVSKAVLTPTEQARLQAANWELRNTNLARVANCPTKDCNFTYRLDDKDAFEKHFEDVHQADKCMWCDERLFKWWDAKQRYQHLRTKHRKQVLDAVRATAPANQTQNDNSKTTSTSRQHGGDEYPPAVDARRSGDHAVSDSRWAEANVSPLNERLSEADKQAQQTHDPFKDWVYFCDRCGRDYRKFSSVYEWKYHDRNCRATHEGHPKRSFCTSCAAPIWDNKKDSDEWGNEDHPHNCMRDPEFGLSHRYCKECGIDKTTMSKDHQRRHDQNCKRLGVKTGSYCNWCGVELETGDGAKETNLQHMEACYQKRKGKKPYMSPWGPIHRIEGNLLVEETAPLPFPPRILSLPLTAWYDQPGPIPTIDPCRECPIPGCKSRDLSKLGSIAIYDHFRNEHPQNQESCPFCLLNFQNKPGKDDKAPKELSQPWEIIKHFDCHVYALWDLLMPSFTRETSDPQFLRERRIRSVPSTPITGSQQVIGESRISLPNLPTNRLQATVTEPNAPASKGPEPIPCEPKAPEPKPSEPEKCLFFESCGAIVGQMTPYQRRDHLRHNHQAELRKSESASDEVSELQEHTESHDTRPNWEGGLRDVGENLDLAWDDPDDDAPLADTYHSRVVLEEANTSKPEKPKRKRAASVRQPAKKVAKKSASKSPSASSLEEVTISDDESSSMASAESDFSVGEPSPPPSRGRTRAKAPARSLPPVSEEDTYSDDRSTADTRRRRAPSPDWYTELGPDIDDFEPDDDMYCSRCLRKAPKRRDRSPGRSPLGREVELEYHTDPTRSCRIRNAVGSADNLPNRSGWVSISNMPKGVGKIKEKFLKKYPEYQRTVYPVRKTDVFSSVWRSDPNNETNQEFWGMPWPAYEGKAPFPGWEAPDDEESETMSKGKRKTPKLKTPRDPRYNYESDEDSADGLEPDGDDLNEEQQVKNDKKQKKKRRRAAKPDDTTNVQGESDSDEPLAARAQKRPKPSPAPPAMAEVQHKPQTRSKAGEGSRASSKAGSSKGSKK